MTTQTHIDGAASRASGGLALLAAIVLLAAITPAVLMTAPALAAQLAAQWQLAPAQIGDLFSCELGAMSLATLPAWWWLRRVDWRRAALAAGLLFVAANLASAFASGYSALLALRFASDEELPDLARRVLTENLTDRKTIKKMIKKWRPDFLRV